MAFWHRANEKLGKEGRWFLSSMAAYGSAEFLVRIVRIAAVIVIARAVSPELMGIAALALSLFELTRVLANSGIGQQIILAEDSVLTATANTAHRLFWLWCLAVGAIQLFVSAILFYAFDQSDAAMMLAMLSGVYLFMPGGLVQVFLLMRDQKMSVTARIGAIQTMADHFLTMVLVTIWPSAWAIVLPKLLTAPIWLIAVRKAKHWQPDIAAGNVPARGFFKFSVGVLGSELLVALRTQADKLIIGGLLGVKALGIYYFAFNAGLGITTSIVTAFSTILFSYICREADHCRRFNRYRQAVFLGLAIFLPIILAQFFFAPIYVPILFGDQWIDAVPLVSILALAGVPIFAASATTAWLRAERNTGFDLVMTTFATITALVGLTLGAKFGLLEATTAYVTGLSLSLLPLSILVYLGARTKASMPLSQPKELSI